MKGGIKISDEDTRSDTTRKGRHEGTIPWNAGRSGAADGPMRLFNDPYVGIGMMAMAPMVRINPNSKILKEYTTRVNNPAVFNAPQYRIPLRDVYAASKKISGTNAKTFEEFATELSSKYGVSGKDIYMDEGQVYIDYNKIPKELFEPSITIHNARRQEFFDKLSKMKFTK